MRKKLIVSDGTRDRELQLVGRIVIGRDPSCDVSHDDSLLSRRHAEFFTAGDHVTVKDLGSRNGVFVNGARAAEQQLAAGDVVQIGPLRARYVVDQSPTSISPEEMDAERTAIFRSPLIPPPTPETSVAAGTPAVLAATPAFDVDSVAEFDSEEEDVTRLVPAPRMPKPAVTAAATPPTPAVVAPAVDDADVTHFSKAPRFSIPALPFPAPPIRPAPAPVPPLEMGRPEPASAVRTPHTVAPPQDLSGFVFGSVVALALVIVLASVLPGMVSAGSLASVAVPIGVALIASYVIGSSINRRITRALEALERKGT
ncbi:MAG: FHA domain-containing protein [Vicinamibacterales bacterium]